jgi:hypothetical protein
MADQQFNERGFIARVESANADELASILARPSVQQERALRAYLGEQRYRRMHNLALNLPATRGTRQRQGRVIVIHGIMGGELTAVDRAGGKDQIWVRALRILSGRIDRLRLADDGLSAFDPVYDVHASGILKRTYGDLLLKLSLDWDTQAFWFDWRKSLSVAADELAAKINGWFGADTPVHIVAHSMGGLVARTFIKKYAPRWESMWDRKGKGRAGGRLIMMGTPNHGSFAIPQVITGLEEMVRLLAIADGFHSRAQLLEIFNSFVGTYQMLPSPIIKPTMSPLYDAATYANQEFGNLRVPQAHLDAARKHHEYLADVIDPERMIYIAGYNQLTYSNITDMNRINSKAAYETTMMGDGRVPHELGLLKKDRTQVKTYYIDEVHGNLPVNEIVLDSLEELLETGETRMLSSNITEARGAEKASQRRAMKQQDRQDAEDEERVRMVVHRLGTRNLRPAALPYVSEEERVLEETLTSGFLSHRPKEEQSMAKSEAKAGDRVNKSKRPSIWIAIAHQGIEAYEPADTPVDAISVGHYIGVKPVAAEKALDVAISMPLRGKTSRSKEKIDEADMLLTQYTERRIIHGALGQPFILPDSRPRGKKNERVIAIAGMGEPGRFGVPELTVMVRELCWALGRLGKTHLATVLIGSGNGNLSVGEAISGWLRGVASALTGSAYDEGRHLKRITFVEYDPRKVKDIQNALTEQADQLESGLIVEIEKLGERELEKIEKEAMRWNRRQWMKQRDSGSRTGVQAPVRITLGFDGRIYRYGAITETASIPERSITLDQALVEEANNEMAAAKDRAQQLDKGLVMETLLLPKELRPLLTTNAPVVMMLDASTARVHWEMVAQPDPMLSNDARKTGSTFLGTSRGFTRQLRTAFAPPPEPPPPPRRTLRVLVVADPADDARLPGAQKEGIEVANLFESFNAVNSFAGASRIEVKRMIGPQEATRTAVLSELLLNNYDVLHYAGHCVYDADDPSSSGWVFTDDKRLSAHELDRIDRIPKFVFSNACESGITPDRSEQRSADLAPSFAESFFARGVSNFVCTAWPVDDTAALEFAQTLYSRLLGLPWDGVKTPPQAMHEAMKDARVRVAERNYGIRTWGAYQHYGNPNFRFFYPTRETSRTAGTARSKLVSGGRKRAVRKASASRRTKQ